MANLNNNRYAFFDVDGTLISIKSMFMFRRYCLGRLSMYCGLFGWLRYYSHTLEHQLLLLLGASREVLNRQYYKRYKGASRKEILSLVRQWYQEVSGVGTLYVQSTLDILDKHRKDGVKTVAVSGSFCELLDPILQELKMGHCLATTLETEGERYTGRIIHPQMIGAGKAQAINAFVRRHSIDLEQCYAYGDDISDLPMLELVGSPTIVSSNPNLVKIANRNGWGVVVAE